MAKNNPVITTDPPKPWERQPNETPKAFDAFSVFRDLDPQTRSGVIVAERLGKSYSLMQKWSQKYGWVSRAAAYDEERDRVKREAEQKAQIEDIKKMRKRHTAVAVKMIDTAEAALNAIDPADVKPADVTRLMDIATKIERISRGDVGEVIEERHGESVGPAVTFYIPDNNRNNTGDEDEE